MGRRAKNPSAASGFDHALGDAAANVMGKGMGDADRTGPHGCCQTTDQEGWCAIRDSNPEPADYGNTSIDGTR